ncbi:hypothetical protein CLOSBL3_12065 [Clostridiaceae bacterium BL-3]|nr:hypothetical protein CLOSBL3_12065 [Clostridiaceae bacterium BL-3]
MELFMFTLVPDDISSGLKVILFSILISDFLSDNATIQITVIENKLKNNTKYPSDINASPLLHTQTLLTMIHP